MISAVVPVYGASPWVRRCVNSLIGQVHQVLVIHDGDGAEPKGVRTSQGDTLIYYDSTPENRGFGATCNYGAECAAGATDWLLFANSDVELLPGCVAAMMAVADEHTIVGAKLLYPDETIQHGGVVPGGGGWFDHRYRFQPRDHEPAGRTEPRLVTGALLLVHRRLFEELGGFDPALRMAFEDVDLELRAIERGAKVVYCGAAEAYHLEGATRGATAEEKAERGPRWAAWEEEARAAFAERWPEERLRDLGVPGA